MNKKSVEVLKASVTGGLMGFGMSFLVNYFFIPVPETIISNSADNGISGLISGFMGGFMGLLMYFQSSQKA